mmetsp:Transcript_15130/g.37079  ORF Transcript_15130/g.37079 Transcript_15130/m.37079 type:complete len:243 (-) Transcript_15130:34-762(-)
MLLRMVKKAKLKMATKKRMVTLKMAMRVRAPPVVTKKKLVTLKRAMRIRTPPVVTKKRMLTPKRAMRIRTPPVVTRKRMVTKKPLMKKLVAKKRTAMKPLMKELAAKKRTVMKPLAKKWTVMKKRTVMMRMPKMKTNPLALPEFLVLAPLALRVAICLAGAISTPVNLVLLPHARTTIKLAKASVMKLKRMARLQKMSSAHAWTSGVWTISKFAMMKPSLDAVAVAETVFESAKNLAFRIES